MSNPLQNSKIYNNIILGGLVSPGLCKLKGGGDREMEVQISNYPGTKVKVANTKGENLIALNYEFILWEDEHFEKWEPFLKMLNAARLATPQPKVLSLVDPRLESVGISQATVTGISSLKELGPTKYSYEIKLLECKTKPKKLGSAAPKSTKEAEEQQAGVSEDEKENARLKKQFEEESKRKP